jgi:hypothetical protein
MARVTAVSTKTTGRRVRGVLGARWDEVEGTCVTHGLSSSTVSILERLGRKLSAAKPEALPRLLARASCDHHGCPVGGGGPDRFRLHASSTDLRRPRRGGRRAACGRVGEVRGRALLGGPALRRPRRAQVLRVAPKPGVSNCGLLLTSTPKCSRPSAAWKERAPLSRGGGPAPPGRPRATTTQGAARGPCPGRLDPARRAPPGRCPLRGAGLTPRVATLDYRRPVGRGRPDRRDPPRMTLLCGLIPVSGLATCTSAVTTNPRGPLCQPVVYRVNQRDLRGRAQTEHFLARFEPADRDV